MNSILFRILFVVLLALSTGQFLQAGPSPQGSQHCGNQTYRGNYGEIGWGAVALPGPLFGPFARVGHAEADGKGNVVAHTFASFNGLIFTVGSYSGTYTVSPDCTIIFNMFIPIPSDPPGFILPLALKGVISENGRDIATMITDPPGLPVRILFRKQERNNCSNQDLSGGYGLDLWGTIVNQPPNPPGPFNRVGKVVFDGNGNFTAVTDASYDGLPAHEELSGSYTVDSSCQLTMHYTLGATNYTWFGGLSDNSSESTLIVTDPPGAVVLGTLKEQ
jgi:hypothetical protein